MLSGLLITTTRLFISMAIIMSILRTRHFLHTTDKYAIGLLPEGATLSTLSEERLGMVTKLKEPSHLLLHLHKCFFIYNTETTSIALGPHPQKQHFQSSINIFALVNNAVTCNEIVRFEGKTFIGLQSLDDPNITLGLPRLLQLHFSLTFRARSLALVLSTWNLLYFFSSFVPDSKISWKVMPNLSSNFRLCRSQCLKCGIYYFSVTGNFLRDPWELTLPRHLALPQEMINYFSLTTKATGKYVLAPFF